MSAYLPIADNLLHRSKPPLRAMSRPSAPQQFNLLFDHLFGDDEQRWRDDEAECLGSCQV
jgi:hypothetical protein